MIYTYLLLNLEVRFFQIYFLKTKRFYIIGLLGDKNRKHFYQYFAKFGNIDKTSFINRRIAVRNSNVRVS